MKVLFVGDLRGATNYGANATTDTLLELLHSNPYMTEIKTIDKWAFQGLTPEGGWKTGEGHYEDMDNVPVRADFFDGMVDRIRRNETWQYEKSLIEWADVVVINGEGSIVNGVDDYGRYRYSARYMIFMGYLTKVLFHKPAYIINHIVDPNCNNAIDMIKLTYPLLDGVYVREKKSCENLQRWGIAHTYVPDALWAHDFEEDSSSTLPECLGGFDFDCNYICLGDSSSIKSALNHVRWDVRKTYKELIDMLKKDWDEIVFIDGYGGTNDEILDVVRENGIRSVNLINCNYNQLYQVFKYAKAFISGRWHASIISLLAHTPIVIWGADSHKTKALYNEIDYKYDFFEIPTLPVNLDRVAEEAKKVAEASHNEIWEKVSWLHNEAKKNASCLDDAAEKLGLGRRIEA